MTLEYLTEHGIITNWDDMGQIQLETFHVPAMCVAVEAVLPLCASGTQPISYLRKYFF